MEPIGTEMNVTAGKYTGLTGRVTAVYPNAGVYQLDLGSVGILSFADYELETFHYDGCELDGCEIPH